MLYYLRMSHAWQQSIKICTTCKAVIILHILVVPHSCGQSEQEASIEQSIKIHFNYHFEQRQNRKVSTQAQLLLFVSPDISLISADSCETRHIQADSIVSYTPPTLPLPNIVLLINTTNDQFATGSHKRYFQVTFVMEISFYTT